jgi:hypothetical protein
MTINFQTKNETTMKKLTITTLLLAFFALTSYAQDTLQNKPDVQKPKATYQVGTVKVTVWENKRQGKYGEFIAKNFKIEKVYKKGDQWKTTNNFNETELLELKAAIDKAISDEQVKIKIVIEGKK